MRRSLVGLAVVDLLLFATAAAGALVVDPEPDVGPTPTSAGGAPRTITAAQVLARPWPARVTPKVAWAARLDGTGHRMTLTSVAGVVVGGFRLATLTLASTDPRRGVTPPAPADNLNLTLPDGARWYPLGPFRLDGAGDLAFTSATASDGQVAVRVATLEGMLSTATSPVAALGRFVSADGREVDRLPLPKSSRVGRDCGRPRCPVSNDIPLVSVAAEPGTVLRARTGVETGEAAIAGSARAQALGRSWDGLVGALEGKPLTATATWDGRAWSLTATSESADQLWMDVWPVADTTLSASSGVDSSTHNCVGDCSVRIRWANTGRATSQIYEAEALGPDGRAIGFDLNRSLGHDAGLGVRRGDRKINLGGGGDVDSNQAPGEAVDRGVPYTPGTEVTLVLRGNFPDVQVRLAIPA